MKKLSFSLIASLFISVIQAQFAPDTTAINKIEDLSYMVGHWEGEGWMMMGPGNRKEFHMKEVIKSQAGGIVLSVEGIGTEKTGTDEEGSIIHEAYGIISYNKDSARYQMTAYSAVSGKILTDFKEISDKVFEWYLEGPGGGKVRFTANYATEGTWEEKGEYSPDGKQWFPFLGMTLKRLEF